MNRENVVLHRPLRPIHAHCFILVLVGTSLVGTALHADELQGRVTQVSGGEVRVSLDSGVLPTAGDPVVVYYQREGSAKRAVVGEGKVARVEGRVVVVKMDDPASAVQVGHLVQVSAHPQEPAEETPLAFDAAVRRLIESSYHDFEDVRGEFDEVNDREDRIYECTVRFEEAVRVSLWVYGNGDPLAVRCSMLNGAGEREAQARFDELERALRILAPREWTIVEKEYEDVGLRIVSWTASDSGPTIKLQFWRPGDGRESFSVDLVFQAFSRRDDGRAKCRSNLNQLGKAVIIYADEHDDHFPPYGPGFFDTLRGILEDPACYVCPSSGDEIGETSYATWSAGAGLSSARLAMLGSCLPLAWDKDVKNHGDVRNVLYHDGRVEEMSEDDFQALLAPCEKEYGMKR